MFTKNYLKDNFYYIYQNGDISIGHHGEEENNGQLTPKGIKQAQEAGKRIVRILCSEKVKFDGRIQIHTLKFISCIDTGRHIGEVLKQKGFIVECIKQDIPSDKNIPYYMNEYCMDEKEIFKQRILGDGYHHIYVTNYGWQQGTFNFVNKPGKFVVVGEHPRKEKRLIYTNCLDEDKQSGITRYEIGEKITPLNIELVQ